MDKKDIRSRADLALYFAHLGFKVGAEIGVADGRYSERLCATIPNLALYCVDPWEPYKGNRRGGGVDQQHGNFDTARKRLEPYAVIFVRQKSMEALKEIDDEHLDFVYIDGNHDFDYVMEDIIGWARKVRSGGIVSGHDYYQFRNSGVIEAVDLYTKMNGLELHLTSPKTDYGEVSWYFVKP